MRHRNHSRRLRRLFWGLCASNVGGAVVELAVALPILVLLAVGVADYARVYYMTITVANAARAGAQYGGHTNGSPDSMVLAAQTDASPIVLDSVTAGRYCKCPDGTTPNCLTGNCGTYGVVQAYDTVRVRKDLATLFNYPGLPATIPIIRTVVFRAQ